MKMAEAAHIRTARHTLIRLADGDLGYLTLRMDRSRKGEKISMLDMCQLTNRLTEHKYYGTYQQLAETIKKYSSAPLLDVQRFWEVVLFSWITGNSDMHCKNFSLIDSGNGEYVLAPAYDLLPVNLIMPEDNEEFALPMNGKKNNLRKKDFLVFAKACGIPEEAAGKMIRFLLDKKPVLLTMCQESLLPEEMKEGFSKLIDQRYQILLG